MITVHVPQDDFGPVPPHKPKAPATAHFPQNNPVAENTVVEIPAEKLVAENIAINIPDLFPPRKPKEPDRAQEAQAEQIRELTHKLAETAEDRDRLRAKVIDLTNANEGMAREIAAYEDRVQRLIAQVENLENHLDAKADEIVRLKAKLWDCAEVTGYLPEEC